MPSYLGWLSPKLPSLPQSLSQARSHRWILWYKLVIPWCVQSFPSWGRMWPRASDLEPVEGCHCQGTEACV